MALGLLFEDCSNSLLFELRKVERRKQVLGKLIEGRFVLRALVGPALFRVEQEGTRFGTQVRLDFASPRLSGPTPTLFYTGTFLGSQRGESVVISTIGAGFRWVRKR
jgi:hypothetical protein